MQANEWVAFGGGIIGGVLGLAVIVGFLYRRVIRPLNVLITRELSPNGGKSIKDDVLAIKKSVDILRISSIDFERVMESNIVAMREHIKWAELQVEKYDQHMKEFHQDEQR